MIRILWGFCLICLTAILVQGCTNSSTASVAGKYSRTARAGYKNTTELKSDGSYTLSTNRGGKFRVLETGTYEVTADTIIFHSQKGEIVEVPFDGKTIYPSTWKSANGEKKWIKEYERVKE